MHRPITLKGIFFVLAVGFAIVNPTASVLADNAAPKLTIDIIPYVWLPTINGTFRFHLSDLSDSNGTPIATDPTQTIDTSVGPNSYLTNLNSGVMASVILHYGVFGLYGDVINANATSGAHVTNITGPNGNLNGTFSAQAQVQVVPTFYTIAPSVTVFHDKSTAVNLLAGGQFAMLSTNANFQLFDTHGSPYSAGASRKESTGAFIAGFYGQVGIAKHLSIPYYVDAGFGSPNSWEAYGGVQYGNLAIAWRSIQYNAVSSSALLQHLNLGGPMLGYRFRF